MMDIKSASQLAKRIDDMLLAHEDSHEVIACLKCLSADDLKSVTQQCFCTAMMVSLDFVMSCSEEDQDWILSQLNMRHMIELYIYLLWQIRQSTSKRADVLKFKTKHSLDAVVAAHIGHPYRCNHARYVQAFDDVCLKHCTQNDFCSVINDVFAGDLSKFDNSLCNILSYSLFSHRLMQYDVFEKLGTGQKIVMLKRIEKRESSIAALSFLVQIMCSKEDLLVKASVYGILTRLDSFTLSVNQDFSNAANSLQDGAESSSFAEFSLKSLIQGKPFASRTFAALLLKTRPSWLAEWFDTDPDEVKSLLSCEDIVELDRLLKRS